MLFLAAQHHEPSTEPASFPIDAIHNLTMCRGAMSIHRTTPFRDVITCEWRKQLTASPGDDFVIPQPTLSDLAAVTFRWRRLASFVSPLRTTQMPAVHAARIPMLDSEEPRWNSRRARISGTTIGDLQAGLTGVNQTDGILDSNSGVCSVDGSAGRRCWSISRILAVNIPFTDPPSASSIHLGCCTGGSKGLRGGKRTGSSSGFLEKSNAHRMKVQDATANHRVGAFCIEML